MKSQCLERERIFALAQGMLGAREQSESRAHVESCSACRKVFESYRALDAMLDEWSPAAEPSPWFDARLRAAVASAKPARSTQGFFGLALNRWLALPVLASVMIIVAVVTFRTSRPPAPVVPAAPVAAPAAPGVSSAAAAPQTAAQELKMYQNLSVLEDYDMLAGFDVISELPKGNEKVAD